MPLAPFVPFEAAPYPVLLDAYPCPAFVVRVQATLRPIWANRAYEAAFGGGDKDSLVRVLATSDDGQRYAMWSVDTKKRCRDEEYSTNTLTVRVRIATGNADLHLIKTRLDDVLIMTCTLELKSDVSPIPTKRIRDNFSIAPVPIKLLTPEGTPVIPSQSPISSRSSSAMSSKLPHTLGAVVTGPCPTATKALFNSHAWENTPLGNPATWSERLRSTVNIMQTSPHPVRPIHALIDVT